MDVNPMGMGVNPIPCFFLSLDDSIEGHYGKCCRLRARAQTPHLEIDGAFKRLAGQQRSVGHDQLVQQLEGKGAGHCRTLL